MRIIMIGESFGIVFLLIFRDHSYIAGFGLCDDAPECICCGTEIITRLL